MSMRHTRKSNAFTMAVLAAAIIGVGSQVQAAVTWTAGGSGGLWSDPLNWGGTTLVGGEDILFDSTGSSTTQDIASLSINSLSYGASAGAFTIGGTAGLTIGAGGLSVASDSALTQTLSTNVALGASQTWTIGSGVSSSSAAVTVSGALSGSGILTKTGRGTLTLSGSNSGYSAGITLKAGWLKYASASALGSGTLTFDTDSAFGSGGAILSNTSGSTITLNNPLSFPGAVTTIDGPTTFGANLSINDGLTHTIATNSSSVVTFNGQISGTGILAKDSAGTLVLNGANSYASTSFLRGTLKLGHDQALGSGVLSLTGTRTGRTLDASGATRTLANDITLDGSTVAAGTILNFANGSFNLNGNVTTNQISDYAAYIASGTSAKMLLSNSGTSVTFGGQVSGVGGLGFNGGSFALSQSNTFSGSSWIMRGDVTVGANNAVGTGPLGLGLNVASYQPSLYTVGGASVTLGNSTFTLLNNVAMRSTGKVTLTGTGVLWGPNGANGSDQIAVSAVDPLGTLAFTGNLSGSRGLDINGTGGAGTIVLGGDNTYSGGTKVTQGKLVVTNTTGSATGSGTVAVGSGATLAGNGHISGPVTLAASAHIAPGESAGTIYTGAVTLSDGAQLDWELAGTTGSDRLDLGANALAMDAPSSIARFNFTTLAGFGPGTYDLITYGSFGGTTGNFTAPATLDGYNVALNQTSTALQLVVTAVPEPTTLTLAGLAAAGLLARRRRA